MQDILKAIDDVTALGRADLDQEELVEFKGLRTPASARAHLLMSVLKCSVLRELKLLQSQ